MGLFLERDCKHNDVGDFRSDHKGSEATDELMLSIMCQKCNFQSWQQSFSYDDLVKQQNASKFL